MDKRKIRKILEKKSRECFYCGIPEDDFIKVWGIFYKTRGKRLEIERKDNNKGCSIENCALACAICNNAKSNKFTEEEFKEVGKVIKKIWKSRIN
jgi:5-methylcytosine-specific restriction endonuclease McrA